MTWSASLALTTEWTLEVIDQIAMYNFLFDLCRGEVNFFIDTWFLPFVCLTLFLHGLLHLTLCMHLLLHIICIRYICCIYICICICNSCTCINDICIICLANTAADAYLLLLSSSVKVEVAYQLFLLSIVTNSLTYCSLQVCLELYHPIFYFCCCLVAVSGATGWRCWPARGWSCNCWIGLLADRTVLDRSCWSFLVAVQHQLRKLKTLPHCWRWLRLLHCRHCLKQLHFY
jgi:hypothetical protein